MANRGKSAATRVAKALGRGFEPKQKTETGVVVGPGLVMINGQLFNGADLGSQRGRTVVVTNIGSAGAALYVPARNTSGAGAAVAGGASGAGAAPGTPGGTSSPYPHYLDDHLGLLSWARVNKSGSKLTDLQEHKHDIVGAVHTVTGAVGSIVGATALNTLGLYASGNDGTAGNVILRTDGSGGIIISNARLDAIYADADLIIDPVTSLDLRGEDILLHPEQRIYFNKIIQTDQTDADGPLLMLNPDTGLIDAESIQANEAYFNAVIAEARWAEAGIIELTKSVAPLKRPFTIPDVGDTGTMYVGYLEGLPGYNPLASPDGGPNLAKVPFFQDGGIVQQPVAWVNRSYAEDEGIATGGGTPLVIYDTDFSEFDPSGLGINLLHTGANNSLSEVTNTVGIYDDSGNDVLRIETNLINCHTHWNGAGAASLEDYVYTGRFKILAANAGIGFTIYSDYPNSDAYYRVRRYSSKPEFYLENHGSGWDMQGDTQSTYDPSDNLSVWHRFRIEVGAGVSGTEIRARFWLDGDSEPGTWDVDCYDANSFRTSGTFGLWYMAGGPNNIMVDDLYAEGLVAYGGGAVSSQVTVLNPTGVENDDYLFCVITYPSTATITPPAGWTQRETKSTSVPAVKSTLYSYWWQTGDPTSHTFSMNAAGAAFGSMIAVRYQRTGSPVFDTSSIAGNNTTTLQPADLDAAVNDMVVYFLVRHDDAIVNVGSIPVGFVNAGISIAPSGSYAHHYYYRKMSETDATYGPTFGALSESGDYAWFGIAAHAEAGQDLPFYVGAAWGYVTLADPQPGDVTAEEVAYTWETLGSYAADDGSSVLAVGKTAQIDTRVQDYGDPTGDVYMILTVLDKKGPPYIKLARHHGYDPATGKLVTELIGQFGQLAGLGIDGTDPNDEPGLVIVKNDGRKVLLTPDQFVMEGTEARWYDNNGSLFLKIDDYNGLMLRSNPSGVQFAWPFTPATDGGYSLTDWYTGDEVGGLYGETTLTDAQVLVLARGREGSGKRASLYLTALTELTGERARVFISAEEDGGSNRARIELDSDAGASDPTVTVTAGNIILNGDVSPIDIVTDTYTSDQTLFNLGTRAGWATAETGRKFGIKMGRLNYPGHRTIQLGYVSEADYGQSPAFFLAVGDPETEAVRVDSGGQVGIGTSDPAYPLDVAGRARASSGFHSFATPGIPSNTVWTISTDLERGAMVFIGPGVGTDVPLGITVHNDYNDIAAKLVDTNGNLEVSTSVLTGTTGNVNKVTVSLVNGVLYIENRLSYNANFTVTLLGR